MLKQHLQIWNSCIINYIVIMLIKLILNYSMFVLCMCTLERVVILTSSRYGPESRWNMFRFYVLYIIFSSFTNSKKKKKIWCDILQAILWRKETMFFSKYVLHTICIFFLNLDNVFYVIPSEVRIWNFLEIVEFFG